MKRILMKPKVELSRRRLRRSARMMGLWTSNTSGGLLNLRNGIGSRHSSRWHGKPNGCDDNYKEHQDDNRAAPLIRRYIDLEVKDGVDRAADYIR